MKVYKEETGKYFPFANKKGVSTGRDCCELQSKGSTGQLGSPFCRAERSVNHTPRISQEEQSPQLTVEILLNSLAHNI